MFRKDFLWGGAVAAHQIEGGMKDGRGIGVCDVMTGGTKDTPRIITDGIQEGLFYPNHEASDFCHHFKEDIALMGEMVSAVSVLPLHGTESIRMEMMLYRMKKHCSSMMICLMNCISMELSHSLRYPILRCHMS